jgi:hypothetical protein
MHASRVSASFKQGMTTDTSGAAISTGLIAIRLFYLDRIEEFRSEYREEL